MSTRELALFEKDTNCEEVVDMGGKYAITKWEKSARFKLKRTMVCDNKRDRKRGYELTEVMNWS